MTNPEKTLQMACTLNDAEFAERRKMVRQKLLPAVTRIERPGTAVRFIFSQARVDRSDVEMFAAFERQCCGFLKFELSPVGEELALLLTGPPEAKPMLDAFADGAST